MPLVSNPSAPAVLAIADPHYTASPVFTVGQQPGNGATSEGGVVDLADRLISVDIAATMDNPMGTASVRLALGKGADNISPMVSTTPVVGGRVALAPHNQIALGFAINGISPGIGSGFIPFAGRIDRVTVADGVVALTCRDMGAYIQEASIRETSMYGNSGGVDAEVVMGQLLDNNGWSRSDLTTPTTSGFAIFPYPVGEVGLLEALRTIAQQIGWDVRWMPYGWREQPVSFLYFYDPGRERTVSDAVIAKNRYDSIQEVSWGDEDVRNDWDVYYADPVTNVPVGPIHVEDAASIAFYARRKARIYLQRAENVRSDAQTLTFGQAALADSKDPFVSHKIKMPLYPNVALNDLHTYQANGVEYDTNLTLAVVGYQHHWESTPGVQATTTIGARGKPLAAYREYRRSVAPPVLTGTNPMKPTFYAPERTVYWVKDPTIV